jgi:hypothetical protein
VVGGSEFRSDPDFLSGVLVEREPRWDSSPGRVTPPHPGNILIIEDDDTSLGEDPFGEDPPDVGRVCGDPYGEGPDPLEPYREGPDSTPGSWADTPFDPSPPRAQEEGDPYFPPPPPGYEDLRATGGADFQARASAGAGPGQEDGMGGLGFPGGAQPSVEEPVEEIPPGRRGSGQPRGW